MISLRIDRARPEDAPGLAVCIDAAYAGYRAQGIDLPPVSEGVAEDIAQSHVWVVRDGALIAGGLILSMDRSCAYLQNVAVHPDYSGHGLGRRMMETALAAAKAHGCAEILLTTHAAIPANVALYRHLGWLEYARDESRVHMRMLLD